MFETDAVNDERMTMSIFQLSPTQAGTTKALTGQLETIAELELDTHFLGTSQHLSKETLLIGCTYCPVVDFFCAYLQAISSLLI